MYYGEVALLDDKGQVSRRTEADLAPNQTLVRHGLGIQVYSKGSRYEGSWAKNKRHGQGKMVHDDGSVYTGGYKNDLKSEQGVLERKGLRYEGSWKSGKFDGTGCLEYEGKVIKGIFKNGYLLQGEALVNSFSLATGEENAKPMKKQKLKDIQNSLKFAFFESVDSIAKVAELAVRSTANRRVLLVTSTVSSGVTKESLKQALGRPVVEFDVRANEKMRRQNLANYQFSMMAFRNELSRALMDGQVLLLNLDDSSVEYEQIFYPDLSNYYDSSCFPAEIWDSEALGSRAVFEPVVGQFAAREKRELAVSRAFSLVVWSKTRAKDGWGDARVKEEVVRRLGSILPLIRLDFAVVRGKS